MHEAGADQPRHHDPWPDDFYLRRFFNSVFDPVPRDQSLARDGQKAFDKEILVGDWVVILMEFHVSVAVDVMLKF